MRGKRPRLVTIGDLTLDIVVRQDAGVESGTDVPAQISFRAGGSAANTARVFAGLGGAATFIGAVGSGGLSRQLRAVMRAAGVTTHLVQTRGSTARLIVLLAPNGERSFLTDRGRADSLTWQHIKPIWLETADVLHLPAYSLITPPLSEAARRAACRAHEDGTLVSVDLASRRPLLAGGPDAATARIAAVEPDVLFANHDEAAALVGRRGLRSLLDLAPLAVVKGGAAGCTVFRGEVEMFVEARPFRATDTTGAGDAFDAGFLYSLISTERAPGALRRLDLRHAAYHGQRAAAGFIRGPRKELTL